MTTKAQLAQAARSGPASCFGTSHVTASARGLEGPWRRWLGRVGWGAGGWLSWRSVGWMCQSPGGVAWWDQGPVLSLKYPIPSCLGHLILFCLSSASHPSSRFDQSATWIEYLAGLGQGRLPPHRQALLEGGALLSVTHRLRSTLPLPAGCQSFSVPLHFYCLAFFLLSSLSVCHHLPFSVSPSLIHITNTGSLLCAGDTDV